MSRSRSFEVSSEADGSAVTSAGRGARRGAQAAHSNTPATRNRAARARRCSGAGSGGFRTAFELQHLVEHALALLGVLGSGLAVSICADRVLGAADLHVSVGQVLADHRIASGELRGALQLAHRRAVVAALK